MQHIETSNLQAILEEAGCNTEYARQIAVLDGLGSHEEALRFMKRVRCDLIETMHDIQRKVDRMDTLIRNEEKKRGKRHDEN